MYPDLRTFKILSRESNLIPIYEEVVADLETPVSAFLKLKSSPSFLLESVIGGEKWARYSFAGTEPSAVITYRNGKITLTKKNTRMSIKTEDPIGYIKDFINQFRTPEIEGLPRFFGGLVGYIGYDMVRFFERINISAKPALNLPEMYLMFTDTLLIFDNLRQSIKIVNLVEPGNKPESAYEKAVQRIDSIKKKLTKKINFRFISPCTAEPKRKKDFLSNVSKEDFLRAVSKAKEYVMSGDVVQVVLSQRFERRTRVDAFDIYRALRLINPSPYMYFLDIGGSCLVGSSPEILVRLEGDRITLRPIAGTRRRGKTEEEDLELERELLNDPKERAEHLMLVDLGRNDVGRVAEIGSVRVSEFMTVERYSHVMHIVSNVEGRLRKGLDCFDVLKSCFPAGTVTGAPKVRSMEIIDELEPVRRGPYSGAVGYFSLNGNMDTCITIRTLIIHKGMVYVQAGAGIVADSVPELEYKETVNKAMAMMKAVELAEAGRCSS
ncbi:MAG: anthranilate synthase component I [Thermodesulfovibrionales bacterium]|nr:anthranilate synthase component I [Thermodesulfovibrionales bacterium]